MKEITIRRIESKQCECKLCGRSDNLLDVKNERYDGALIICKYCFNDISHAWDEYNDSMLSFDEIVKKLMGTIDPHRSIFIVKRPNETAFATTNFDAAVKRLAIEIVKSVFLEKKENLKNDLYSVRISENDFLHPLNYTDELVYVKEFIENPSMYEYNTGIKIIGLLDNENFEL